MTHDDVLHVIGMTLRKQRQGQKLRLRHVASGLDLSIAHVSEIERGCVTPSIFVLYRIASFLRISLSELFQGVDIIPEQNQEQTKEDASHET